MAVPEAPGGILLQAAKKTGKNWKKSEKEKGEKRRWYMVERLLARDHLVTGESEGHEEPLGSDGMTRHSREVVEMLRKPGKP
ncbi:hypothetical protein CRG98_009328 [Punica granatum]|uniref:Uncharacterized protein n=1 Tax=Punica granatum TaxID=22663 RepID=A0A2I0KP33_PUNGR|nr:hypothetical protein CRG98_009328 [Punica granatum]